MYSACAKTLPFLVSSVQNEWTGIFEKIRIGPPITAFVRFVIFLMLEQRAADFTKAD